MSLAQPQSCKETLFCPVLSQVVVKPEKKSITQLNTVINSYFLCNKSICHSGKILEKQFGARQGQCHFDHSQV